MAQCQGAELVELCEAGQAGVRDVGVTESEFLKTAKARDLLQASVGDRAVRKVQHPEILEVSQVRQASVADLRLAEEESLQEDEAAQVRNPVVRHARAVQIDANNRPVGSLLAEDDFPTEE